MVDKKILVDFLKKVKAFDVPDNFIGKVTLEINFSQGGVNSVERSVKEIFR